MLPFIDHSPRQNSTTGMVATLRSVVIKVVKETRSGSVPNWMANIVVFAAAGIAACIISTCFSKVLIGMNETISAASNGDSTMRMTDTKST